MSTNAKAYGVLPRPTETILLPTSTGITTNYWIKSSESILEMMIARQKMFNTKYTRSLTQLLLGNTEISALREEP